MDPSTLTVFLGAVAGGMAGSGCAGVLRIMLGVELQVVRVRGARRRHQFDVRIRICLESFPRWPWWHSSGWHEIQWGSQSLTPPPCPSFPLAWGANPPWLVAHCRRSVPPPSAMRPYQILVGAFPLAAPSGFPTARALRGESSRSCRQRRSTIVNSRHRHTTCKPLPG